MFDPQKSHFFVATALVALNCMVRPLFNIRFSSRQVSTVEVVVALSDQINW